MSPYSLALPHALTQHLLWWSVEDIAICHPAHFSSASRKLWVDDLIEGVVYLSLGK